MTLNKNLSTVEAEVPKMTTVLPSDPRRTKERAQDNSHFRSTLDSCLSFAQPLRGTSCMLPGAIASDKKQPRLV